MTEQELRDKIIGIVLDIPITGVKIREILGGEATANAIADALIAAGIGDVKAFGERVKMAFYYEFDELIPSIMADKIDELVEEAE